MRLIRRAQSGRPALGSKLKWLRVHARKDKGATEPFDLRWGRFLPLAWRWLYPLEAPPKLRGQQISGLGPDGLSGTLVRKGQDHGARMEAALAAKGHHPLEGMLPWLWNVVNDLAPHQTQMGWLIEARDDLAAWCVATKPDLMKLNYAAAAQQALEWKAEVAALNAFVPFLKNPDGSEWRLFSVEARYDTNPDLDPLRRIGDILGHCYKDENLAEAIYWDNNEGPGDDDDGWDEDGRPELYAHGYVENYRMVTLFKGNNPKVTVALNLAPGDPVGEILGAGNVAPDRKYAEAIENLLRYDGQSVKCMLSVAKERKAVGRSRWTYYDLRSFRWAPAAMSFYESYSQILETFGGGLSGEFWCYLAVTNFEELSDGHMRMHLVGMRLLRAKDEVTTDAAIAQIMAQVKGRQNRRRR